MVFDAQEQPEHATANVEMESAKASVEPPQVEQLSLHLAPPEERPNGTNREDQTETDR